MDLGAGAAHEVLTPPLSPGQGGARASKSRSGSRGKRAGAGDDLGKRDAPAVPAGQRPSGGLGAREKWQARVKAQRQARAQRQAAKRQEQTQDEAKRGAGDQAGAERTSNVREVAPPTQGGEVSVRRRSPEAKAKARQVTPPRRPSGNSPHPQRTVGPVSAVEEVAYAKKLPAARTLSISPIRWQDHGEAEGGQSNDQRSPGRADAPWKRANREKKKSPSGSPQRKKGKNKGQKGQGKGGAKGQGKGKKGAKGKK